MKAVNPVLVELVRGSVVESRHRGSIAVCDAKGKLVKSWGGVSYKRYGGN